ncbi:acyl-CoA thioester hydrolase/BAAT C-terminal domain-containing protein [Microbacterium sp.]|uniref:acyl-CoA thioester hydrolase/BAAT C-terminal domain-containing protein n=1 Tax=Microbacterium sp. TaxID=51671 RepID=UPI0028125824|nr:acyl-CoA thioester hydrolase/BAAT C-terminal domain-containing protein [Microbacterium sp.]
MPVPFALVSDDDSYDAVPEHPSGGAVLVLAGSSGRIERDRADLLAAHGIRARAIRWFGGRGQRTVPFEVPLELFIDELERLQRESDRVSIIGTSFGAEAALVTATITPVHAAVAISPSSVVWGGVQDGTWSSHWTHEGRPLPWVPFEPTWTPDTDPPEYRGLYEASMRRDAEATAAAEIPAERISAPVLLTAGGDDRVWPSTEFASAICRRRERRGLPTMSFGAPAAGHRILLPGESVAAAGGVAMRRGGTEGADRALGQQVWPMLLDILR